MMRQLLQNLLLRGPVEVDDHVAAEDDIRLLLQPIVGVHEIETAKLNQVPQLGNNSHLLRTAVAAAQEVPSPQFRRDRGNNLGAEYGKTGLSSTVVQRSVASTLKRNPGCALAYSLSTIDKRVRLFSRRAAGAPDQQRPSAPRCLASSPAAPSSSDTRSGPARERNPSCS